MAPRAVVRVGIASIAGSRSISEWLDPSSTAGEWTSSERSPCRRFFCVALGGIMRGSYCADREDGLCAVRCSAGRRCLFGSNHRVPRRCVIQPAERMAMAHDMHAGRLLLGADALAQLDHLGPVHLRAVVVFGVEAVVQPGPIAVSYT